MVRFGRLLLSLGLLGMLLILAAGTVLAQGAARASLAPSRQDSRMNGTSTLAAQGNQTMVTVRVAGAPVNGTHVNHIHTGTCQNEGGIVYPLADLRVDASGTATATTLVNTPLSTLLGAPYYVNVHAGAALPSPGVSCGNIVAGASALPATGGAPVGAALPALASAGIAAVGVATIALRRRAR